MRSVGLGFLAFRAHYLPWRDAMISFLYYFAMVLLGAQAIKALVIAIVIFLCLFLRIGRRAIERGGLIIFAYAFAVWLEALPPPVELRAMIHSAGDAILSALKSH